jgi:HlyD family secretion protein
MAQKKHILLPAFIIVVIVAASAIYFLSNETEPAQLATAKAVRREIRLVVSTNGIIEPVDRSDIYAPISAFISRIETHEGSEIAKGRLLMQLESKELRTALAEAKAALLEQKRQARVVMTGPSREEIAEVDASIAESDLQLKQLKEDLAVEESLLAKGATPREAVEKLQNQRTLLQLHGESLRKKKQDLEQRYSAEEKKWEQDKVAELSKQVNLLEQQLKMESVYAPNSGLIYSLPVRQGSYVTNGQLLAQIYQPGNVRLRAYVDEPDLGKIKKGQAVVIQWDGLPDKQWSGVVDRPAEQVVALDNRSVGYVLCSIDDSPKELIPNLNVKVEITTASKKDALVVPRSAIFSDKGKPSVLLMEGTHTVVKPVTMGLVTTEEIEILQGVQEGDSVVLYPAEAPAKK